MEIWEYVVIIENIFLVHMSLLVLAIVSFSYYIYTKQSADSGRNMTIFSNFRVIKIELNQSKLPHHTSLDAILLAGYQPKSTLQRAMIEKGIIKLNKVDGTRSYSQISNNIHDNLKENGDDLFFNLPVSE